MAAHWFVRLRRMLSGTAVHMHGALAHVRRTRSATSGQLHYSSSTEQSLD